MLKKIKYIVLALIFALLFAACSEIKPTTGEKKPETGEISYQVIQISSEEFNTLNKGDFKSWYEENYRIKGVHSFTKNNERYVLVSAGEKPTAGYVFKGLLLEGDEYKISVRAKLYCPAKDEMAAQVITYPHMLVKINPDGRYLLSKDIEEYSEVHPEDIIKDIKKDTGKYVGLIDSNSIEVKISGVPDSISARAFRLNEAAKEKINKLNLKTGEEIIFSYTLDKNNSPVIIEIERL